MRAGYSSCCIADEVEVEEEIELEDLVAAPHILLRKLPEEASVDGAGVVVVMSAGAERFEGVDGRRVA